MLVCFPSSTSSPPPTPTTNPNFPFQPSANKSQRQHHRLEKRVQLLKMYLPATAHARRMRKSLLRDEGSRVH